MIISFEHNLRDWKGNDEREEAGVVGVDTPNLPVLRTPYFLSIT